MSRVRLVPVALIVIVSLAILFGFWRLYLQLSLVNPLVTTVEHIPGVQSASVISESPPVLAITLKPTSDLQSSYNSIKSQLAVKGESGVSIQLIDHSDQELNQIYETIMLSVLQDVAHGNYTLLPKAAQQAERLGAKAKISQDEHYIYIQLSKGNHYFYKIFPYTLP